MDFDAPTLGGVVKAVFLPHLHMEFYVKFLKFMRQIGTNKMQLRLRQHNSISNDFHQIGLWIHIML